jgi:hypothetical protein
MAVQGCGDEPGRGTAAFAETLGGNAGTVTLESLADIPGVLTVWQSPNAPRGQTFLQY